MRINNCYLNFGVKKTPNLKFKNSKQSSVLYNTEPDTVSFKGVAEMKFPHDILLKMPDITLEKLYKVAENPKNLCGKGANSEVFNIPSLEKYVVKFLNKNDPNKVPLNIFPENVNLGQPVWQSNINPRVLILKKIEGEEYSIPNWSGTIFNPETYHGEPVTRKQTALYFEKLLKVSQMNQASYDTLLEKVKILDENDFKLDSINPNNMIVDFENNEINIIDYFKVKPDEKHLYQNSSFDVVALISDFTLFTEYYDKMNEKEKAEALNAISTVYNKVDQAAQKSGLSRDKEVFKTFVQATSQWFFPKSVKKENGEGMYFRYYDVRLDDFLEMLDNPQKWELKSKS